MRHNRKEQKKRSVYHIGKLGVFALYGIDEIQELACYMYVPGKRKIGEIGDFTINL